MNEPLCPKKLTYLSFSDYLLELDGVFAAKQQEGSELSEEDIIVRNALPFIARAVMECREEHGEKLEDTLDPTDLRDSISLGISTLYERICNSNEKSRYIPFSSQPYLYFREIVHDLNLFREIEPGKSRASESLLDFFEDRLTETYNSEISNLRINWEDLFPESMADTYETDESIEPYTGD